MEISKLRSDRVQEGKISENKGAANADKASELQQQNDLKKAGSPTSTSTTEKVKWSDDSGLLAEGVQAAKNSPDIRAERVAQLKAAIRGGTYKVDAHAVADKMIQGSLEEDILSRKS